jgi:eukaryotic-like serine/threonine-protein kinase
VLAVLVVAGTYLPHRTKAGTGEKGPALPQSSNPAPQTSTQAPVPPDTNSGNASESVPPPPTTPPVEVAPAPGDSSAASGTAPSPYVNAADTAKSVNPAPSNPPRARRNSNKGTAVTESPSNSSVQDNAHAPDVNASAAAQAQQAAAAAAQMEELEKQFDQISTRSNAVGASLDTLRQQQASQGLNLRGDVAASEERLHTYVNRAQAALQSQDTASAEKYLKLAEPELDKIEKFLGH